MPRVTTYLTTIPRDEHEAITSELKERIKTLEERNERLEGRFKIVARGVDDAMDRAKKEAGTWLRWGRD